MLKIWIADLLSSYNGVGWDGTKPNSERNWRSNTISFDAFTFIDDSAIYFDFFEILIHDPENEFKYTEMPYWDL